MPSRPAGTLADLHTRLLAIGGEKVFAPSEPHLDILLARGRVFEAKGRKRVRGGRHRCHQNTALHYARHHTLGRSGICEIATGYGLYRDGLWLQHSWLWDGERVIETNTDPRLYFGVVLTPPEAAQLVFYQVMPILPGYPLPMGRRAA
jgi:hypothetical protein